MHQALSPTFICSIIAWPTSQPWYNQFWSAQPKGSNPLLHKQPATPFRLCTVGLLFITHRVILINMTPPRAVVICHSCCFIDVTLICQTECCCFICHCWYFIFTLLTISLLDIINGMIMFNFEVQYICVSSESLMTIISHEFQVRFLLIWLHKMT